MTKRVIFFLMIGVVCGFGDRIPPGGTVLALDRDFTEWSVSGGEARTVNKEVRSVSRIPYKQCVELEQTARTSGGYDIRFDSRIAESIARDDVLLCSFYARCLESSDESALGRFTVGSTIKHRDRMHRPFSKTYTVGNSWKHFLIPFEAPVSSDGGYQVGFRLGGVKPQTLQFAGFEIINYGTKMDLDDLPHTETQYEGMEPDAPWRKAADQRIREYRMENLKVKVVDRNGAPVEGAKVRMTLTNHAFGFGVAINVGAMFSDQQPEQAQHYRDAVEELFNKAVFENRMKWRFHRENDEQLEKAMAWCKARNIPLRGHVMVWPAWQRLPDGMKEEWGGKTNAFRQVIEEHVQKMATAYPDIFSEWDVVNELYSQHEFVDLYGKDVVVDWFRIAKEANPAFKRYINDYGILSGDDLAHQNNYHEWIGYLLEQGAPIDGIGLQGHFRAPVPPEEILRRLDRFAEFGLEMQITEYDYEDTDELLQARYTRDFMTAVFSHPKTTGIMTWCLWEDAAWKPAAAFYSSDWKKRRIALAWEHMIKNEWHTDATRMTNAEGLTGVRGFLGDYQITVQADGRTLAVDHRLEKGQDELRIQL